jgi:hypothetical protein
MTLPAISSGNNLFARRDDDDLAEDGNTAVRSDAERGAGDGATLGVIRDALLAVAQNPRGGVDALAQIFGDPSINNNLFSQLSARSSGRSAPSSETSGEEQVKSAFEDEFAAKAANKEEFDAFMQQVFGDKYDKDLAEQYRQQALNGDFSFLPDVKFVDAATLQGGKGAYNEAEGVVYINRDIAASDPDLAAQVFVEEAGAHLDAKLNTVDTQGDEGEMFRRVLSGEQLSAREIEAIRNDDDHGTITVDGKKVEVEFWFGEDIVDAVGGAVKDVVVGAVEGIQEVGKGIVGSVKDVGKGLWEMTGGFVSNLVHGNIGEALDSVVRGIDHAVFQSTERLVSGVLKSAQKAVNGITNALGPIGKPLRWVNDRMFDLAQTGLDTAFGMARDAFRFLPDIGNGFVSDVERSIKLAADGRWGDAFKQFGMSFVNVGLNTAGGVVDMAARMGQSMGSAALTAVGAEPPARGLNHAERQYLEAIYGDSIDYDMIRIKQGGPLNDRMDPHTVGNTVYLPSKLFDPNGNLTPVGLETLGHEVGHVWQNQNGGGDYIHNALFAQWWGSLTQGAIAAAYNWRQALSNGESFESMNDEERAAVMEAIGAALKNDGQITAADGGAIKPYTPAEVAFLRDVAEEIQSGEGAG